MGLSTRLHLTSYKYHYIYTYRSFNLVLAEIQNKHEFTSYNFMARSTNNTTYTYTKTVCFPQSQEEPLFLGYGLQYGTTEY